MSSYRMELSKEQWDLLEIVIGECDQPDLGESDKINLKIIYLTIKYNRSTYHECDHEYGRIVSTVCVNSETRMQPAEYESTAECLICGNEMDAQDVQNILK
jgi:hypothetical protein